MGNTTFIVHKEWLRNIEGLPVEQQDKIIAEFVRYGCDMELEHNGDAVVQAFVNMLKGRIDFSKDKYEQKVKAGKTSGRKKKIDDQAVYNLAREGKNSRQIAEIIGVSKSSVDHSEGWKRRSEEVDFNAEFEF